MTDDYPTSPSPCSLRAAMVDRIVAGGWARSQSVIAAMRAVPRHLFVPATAVEAAYADQAVITKRAGDGAALSCASVPSMVALMLEQLEIKPGDRILEIGAGTGYNAALLSYLAGRRGRVTTVDIDSEITAQARRALDATGYEHVHVVTANGVLGDAHHAPYDRIIVTVGAWDIPLAWWTQLMPGGRLVLPLRWRGQTRTVAFTLEPGRMFSDSVELCGFVPMVGQEGERASAIHPDGRVVLHWDEDQPIDAVGLRSILDQPRALVRSGMTVDADEPFDGVWLRLTATEPGICRIAADPTAVKSGLCTPAIPIRSPALVEGDSLAYLTLHRRGDPSRFEMGAIGHGPAALDLAERICDQIRAWDLDRGARPIIAVYPSDAAEQTVLDKVAIRKRHSRLLVTF